MTIAVQLLLRLQLDWAHLVFYSLSQHTRMVSARICCYCTHDIVVFNTHCSFPPPPPPPAPSSPPKSIEGSVSSSTSIQLSWQPPAPSSQNGIIQHYVISVTEEETMRQFRLISTTTSITATALHPYYTYSFTISAVTVGEGPYSQPLSLQTLEDGEKDTTNSKDYSCRFDWMYYPFSSQWSTSVIPSGGYQFHKHQTDLVSSTGTGTEWSDHLLRNHCH